MSYIFTYDPQYSDKNFNEQDIVKIVTTYDLLKLQDWLTNAAPDKKKAAIAFKEAIKNDWIVGMDIILNSGWAKEKKLITDGWYELLIINMHVKNKEGSLAEQWLISKTFNNKPLFSNSNLNKLSIELAQFANSGASIHYWNLFLPYIKNLKVVDGARFFWFLHLEYNSRIAAKKHVTEEQRRRIVWSNMMDVLKLSIPIESRLIFDILKRDGDEELFFKIIESPLFINSQELMGLAIYVPMYFKLYKQNIKKVPKDIIDGQLARAFKAFKKLNIPEYEVYSYHTLMAHYSLVGMNNEEHFSIGPFDLWNQSKLDYAYHLPSLKIKPNESIRVYLGDCFFAEPNANNEYEILTEEQKTEHRRKAI